MKIQVIDEIIIKLAEQIEETDDLFAIFNKINTISTAYQNVFTRININYINGTAIQGICLVSDWKPGAIVFVSKEGERPYCKIIEPHEFFGFMDDTFYEIFEMEYPEYLFDEEEPYEENRNRNKNDFLNIEDDPLYDLLLEDENESFEFDSDRYARTTCFHSSEPTQGDWIDNDWEECANKSYPAPQPQASARRMSKDEFCPTCGSLVLEDQMFCYECGTMIHHQTSKQVNLKQVEFSAVVPNNFTKGNYSTVDIVVYEEDYRHIVDRIIENADSEVKEKIGSSQSISDNTMIRIQLTSPDIDLYDCEETQKWQGKYLNFYFPIEIPKDYPKEQILFIAKVYFNDVIATKIKFIANCYSKKEQSLHLIREDVLTAFISYASQDRSRVATIIQGMKKARPDMNIFFDIESLHSGEYWEHIIKQEIDQRDILYLCWSKHAQQSEWVEKEWRYALENKGLDAIEPVPLDPPTECPPPEELKSKHFNDRTLLYM